VPVGTPNHNIGTHLLPATGPYEIVSDTPREVILVRNRYFHEWSHAAQPDGYPDRIVWRIGASTDAAVTAVERSSADFTLDGPPPGRLGELRTRFASQLNVNPNDVTILMGLNTGPRRSRTRGCGARSTTRSTAPHWQASWARTPAQPASCSHRTSPATSATVPTR
jgi:hypothetical protein